MTFVAIVTPVVAAPLRAGACEGPIETFSACLAGPWPLVYAGIAIGTLARSSLLGDEEGSQPPLNHGVAPADVRADPGPARGLNLTGRVGHLALYSIPGGRAPKRTATRSNARSRIGRRRTLLVPLLSDPAPRGLPPTRRAPVQATLTGFCFPGGDPSLGAVLADPGLANEALEQAGAVGSVEAKGTSAAGHDGIVIRAA